MDDLLIGGGIGIEQPLYDLLLQYRLRDNFRNILGLYLEITNFIGVNYDDRTPFAKAVATGPSDFHFIIQALFTYLRFKACGNFPAARSMAGRPRTKRNAGFIRIPLRQDALSEFFQFGW
jgi:hypothetical protein